MSQESLSLLARLIIDCNHTFNGHNQIELTAELTVRDLLSLLAELEGVYDNINCRMYPEGDGSIYANDFWEEGEHKLGHRDKLLFSWNSSNVSTG